MFTIHYINSQGKEEMSGHVDSIDAVLENLKRALETLKTLPGAKIEIDYTVEEEVTPTDN